MSPKFRGEDTGPPTQLQAPIYPKVFLAVAKVIPLFKKLGLLWGSTFNFFCKLNLFFIIILILFLL